MRQQRGTLAARLGHFTEAVYIISLFPGQMNLDKNPHVILASAWPTQVSLSDRNFRELISCQLLSQVMNNGQLDRGANLTIPINVVEERL